MGIAVGRDLTGGVCDYLTRAKRAVARTTFTPREQLSTQRTRHTRVWRVRCVLSCSRGVKVVRATARFARVK